MNLNDYHFKAGRHSNGSICMNFMVTINQKHTIDSQKPKRKGLKHTTKKFIKSWNEKQQKRNDYNKKRTTKTTGKQEWKYH